MNVPLPLQHKETPPARSLILIHHEVILLLVLKQLIIAFAFLVKVLRFTAVFSYIVVILNVDLRFAIFAVLPPAFA